MKDRFEAERRRILAENARRERDLGPDRYSASDPAEAHFRASRSVLARQMLDRGALLPGAGSLCLEVGYGRGGWIPDLLGWGVSQENVHGIELDPARATEAQARYPRADLRVGDATRLPWDESSFDLVVVSTVFTSILDGRVREEVARQIERVVRPSGAVLWYDFRVGNPANRAVRAVSRRELRALFEGFTVRSRSVSLAPPLTRALIRHSAPLVRALERLPFLRTHLLAILEPSGPGSQEGDLLT